MLTVPVPVPGRVAPPEAASSAVRGHSAVRGRRVVARAIWWLVVLGGQLALLATLWSTGQLPARATEASLLCCCLAVAARHDGLVRVIGRLGVHRPSYLGHQLTYELGQLHRGFALAGLGWLLVATTEAVRTGGWLERIGGGSVCVVLLLMAWTARAVARTTSHELFERVHRYGGWGGLVVLVALVAGPGAPRPDGTAVVLLLILLALVAHPWLSVRWLPVEVLTVTPQIVVLALPGHCSRGDFVRVSRDGREWHAFAVSTTQTEGANRCCLVIRRAGDWTERLGRDAEQGHGPTRLAVRRLRGFGFMGHARVYRRVLVLATGAGIGPVLPYLLGHRQAGLRCLWIGRDHRAAVGGELVDRLLATGQVTLVDTTVGRPDIAALVGRHAPAYDAVFVVSNAAVRDVVADACERLRICWYGPTFDS